MKQKNNKTAVFFRILACITFAGLVFRLIAAAQLISADPSAYDPSAVTDMATYRSISSEILKGKIPDVFYYQPFYYSVFLPAAQLIFRSVTWGTAIAQALCSAGIIWFAGLCGAMLRGRRSGIFTAVIACFSAMLVFYVPYALIEIQQAFWFTLLFWFTLRGYRTGKWKFWCGAGITLSFAILSRGNAWCFVPAVLTAMYFRQKNFHPSFSLKCRILSVILLFVCILLPQLPFIVHNSIALKRLSGPSTAGSAVLALGNNPESAAGYLEYPETYKRWFDLTERKSVISDIAGWAMTEPFAFLELQMRKFLLYWDGREIPNNVSLEINGKRSSFLPAAGWMPTSWILILAMASFFLLFRCSFRRKGLLFLNLFIVLYAAAAAAFYILARFRVPSIGLLTISAGMFPDYLFRMVKNRKKKNPSSGKTVICVSAAFAGSVLIVGGAYDFYREYYESAVMRLIRPHGVCVEFAGNAGYLSLDHGSRFLGGWKLAEWNNGMILKKQFSPRDDGWKKYSCSELELTLFSETPGTAEFMVNGVYHKARISPEPDSHLAAVTFPDVKWNGAHEVSVQLIRTSVMGKIHAVFDMQRDYGRTEWNREVMPCEAVCRIRFLPENPE